MTRSILKTLMAASVAMVMAGAVSAGIFPGDGCGCIHPCFPPILH